MTYDQFVALITSLWDHGDSKNFAPAKKIRRYGQILMNELYNIWPEKYNEIKNTKYDCFHDDSASGATMEMLKKEWENKQTVQQTQGGITFTTTEKFLEEVISPVPNSEFVPYAYYDKDMDFIQVYFKDKSCYTQSLNKQLELYLSFDNDEVVGMKIFNISKLTQ